MELLEIAVEPLDGAVAAPLVAELERDLQVRYGHPGAAGRALDPAAFAAPGGTFLVAGLGDRPVGCAGLRTVAPGLGELKRMYVRPHARGHGVARALLAAVEQAGRDRGLERLRLETGQAQPEAIALYDSAGWTRIAPFGEWEGSADLVCFGRELRPG